MLCMPKQIPKIGISPANRSIDAMETPASVGEQGPGETEQRRRCRGNLIRRNFIIAMYGNVCPEFPQILDNIPSEGIVVVDH